MDPASCLASLASSSLLVISKKRLRLFSALELPSYQNLNFLFRKKEMFEF
jgi:hypothetical protein